MPSLDGLARTYTMALRASTVRPSRTVAALASLATGVAPETHGLIEPGLGFLARLPTLRPRARDVARAAQALALAPSRGGLVFVYLNDCDQAGHAHGWMSPQYRALTQAFTKTSQPAEAAV
jgi:predicted AlkP superfamily pyrophosphatase or phosphodiesterase